MIKRIMDGVPLFTEEEAERAKEELVLEANLTRGFTFTGPNKSETVKLEKQDIIKREKIEEMIEKTIKSMGFVMPNSTLLGEDGGSVLEALEELRAKVNSLNSRSETLEAGEEQGILNRLRQVVKIKSRRVEVSKPIPPKDLASILKDSKELKELKEKVDSLSSRSETLEAGEKLSTLYWLKQMAEINSILKDIEELKKLKDKVEPLKKPKPSEDIEELRKKVESLSSRSETLAAGEKLGILNWLKQMVKIKPRRVEVPKPSLSGDKISLISKDREELKKLKDKVESLPSGEKKEIGGRIIEEKII